MKLIRALHKSEYRAAILALPTHLWSEVIVEHGPHQYSTEIHQYNRDGELSFQIIDYGRKSENQIRLQLSDEFYFSDLWEPYDTPTPQKITRQIQTIRSKMRPRQHKNMPIDLARILKEVYG